LINFAKKATGPIGYKLNLEIKNITNKTICIKIIFCKIIPSRDLKSIKMELIFILRKILGSWEVKIIKNLVKVKILKTFLSKKLFLKFKYSLKSLRQ